MAYSDVILADGPASYWRLGESSGTNAADQQGANAGTYMGGFTLAQPGALSGDPDTAVTLDGSTGYVTVPFASALNASTFTYEAWAFPTGGAGNFRAVLSDRDVVTSNVFGAIIYANGSGAPPLNADQWSAWFGTGTSAGGTSAGWFFVTNNTPVVLNVWTYLAFTYDGTTGRLYINGALDSSTIGTYSPNTARALRIGAGANETAAGVFFPGSLDEVAVYGYALTTAQIQEHYLASIQTPPFIPHRMPLGV